MKEERCFTGCLKENKTRRHAEFISASHLVSNLKSGEILNQVQDDGTNYYNGNNAFTLIELLVVVLIIGILAAVAMPQYKLAVAKARMTQLVTLSNAVVQAQERYYLANGKYADNFEELDIDISGSLHGNILSNSAGWSLEIRLTLDNATYASDSRLPGILLIFANQHSSWQGKRACYAVKTNQFANALCKTATGKPTPDTDEPVRYIYYF